MLWAGDQNTGLCSSACGYWVTKLPRQLGEGGLVPTAPRGHCGQMLLPYSVPWGRTGLSDTWVVPPLQWKCGLFINTGEGS